jgi:predicted 3-demethylubiquinone-9 3-methyltransferase (glyoxalase superfamily)
MQKITTFLWFDDKAEEAAKFYVSLFRNSKLGDISRYNEENEPVSGRPRGSVMVVTFTLNGQEFMALNGGPHFKFSEAISLFVHCDTQAEVDMFWEKLSEGGQTSQCGWLKDKYGLSWQIVPRAFSDMMRDKNPKKTTAIMAAMLKMTKLDIAKLKEAYASV